VALVLILASCQALAAPRLSMQRLDAQPLVLRGAGDTSDRPRPWPLLNCRHGLEGPCRAGHAGTAGMTTNPCQPSRRFT
jgi:hypothetical protein